MTSYLARHAVTIFAVSAALFGLGMGASGVYRISQYESHDIAAYVLTHTAQ